MQCLSIRNNQISVIVSEDAELQCRLTTEGRPDSRWVSAKHRLLEIATDPVSPKPYDGLRYYDIPRIYESLVVRVEGQLRPIFEERAGELPVLIEEAELGMYPSLHYLAERRSGDPMRSERWYTLVGPYLVFESCTYFERPARGISDPMRRWERVVMELQQVTDVVAWASGREMRWVSVFE